MIVNGIQQYNIKIKGAIRYSRQRMMIMALRYIHRVLLGLKYFALQAITDAVEKLNVVASQAVNHDVVRLINGSALWSALQNRVVAGLIVGKVEHLEHSLYSQIDLCTSEYDFTKAVFSRDQQFLNFSLSSTERVNNFTQKLVYYSSSG